MATVEPDGVTRFLRHFVSDERAVGRRFGPDGLGRIEAAIKAGEQAHRGQVRFAVEGALPLQRVMGRITPRERALEVFGLSRTWDTEENCGVLIYLLLADRDVEIVADRGIHRRVGDAAWEAICTKMEAAFRNGRFVDGCLDGIAAVNGILEAHFPRGEGPVSNELPDRPLVL
ncbi:MAG: TPM domain-containing protein [Casimicrobiaceae bacterium]